MDQQPRQPQQNYQRPPQQPQQPRPYPQQSHPYPRQPQGQPAQPYAQRPQAPPMQPQPQPAAPPQQAPQPSLKRKMCVWAVLSLIFAFLLFPLGLIFGIVALVKVNKDPSLKGKGLAIAGLIISGLLFVLIPVLIALGAVAYFGVLDPDGLIPSRCVTPAGLECVDFSLVTDTQLDITLTNNLGSDIGNVRVTVEELCTPADTDIANGESAKFTCPISSGASGGLFRSSITIDYVDTRSSLEQQGTGNVQIQR